MQTIAKSRKLAASVAQPALLALLLGFIGVLLFANIAVTLALFPQLVRILTGYESSFTRAGFRFLTDPSFYLVVSLFTWIALEPLVQVAYTVAAFHAESQRTGQDVRIRLRTLLRSGTIAALLLILCSPSLPGKPSIDPEQLDRSVRRTLASPEYGWHSQRPAANPQQESWLVRFTDSLGARLSSVRRAIGRGIDRLVDWLRKLFEPPPSPQSESPPSGGAIRVELYLALALALLAAAYFIWRGRAVLARRTAASLTSQQAVSLTAENVTADQLPEESWYTLAGEYLSNGQFRLGLRALYLANLAGLSRGGWIAIHPGKTNHEYERELSRRARAFSEACILFSSNIQLFERVWYGDHPVSFEDCQAFRGRSEEMNRQMDAAGVSI